MPEILHHLYLNWFGHFTLKLAVRGADVVGVDRAAALLRRAHAKASTHQSRLTWVQGKLASLPLASQSLEGALALLALDFIEARPGSPGTGPGGAPLRFSGGRGLKPLPFWERLGARLLPEAAAFLVAAARKQGA